MAVVFVLVLLVVLGLLAGVHWYLWRRLVRDTTAPGGTGRRIGTAAAVVLPLTTLGAFVSGRSGAPFWVEQVFAWPGYLWLACLLYLTLAVLVGEAVRPLLRRALAARAEAKGTRPDAGATTRSPAGGTAPAGGVPATAPVATADDASAAPAGTPGAGPVGPAGAGPAEVSGAPAALARAVPEAGAGGAGTEAPVPARSAAPAGPLDADSAHPAHAGVAVASATATAAPAPAPAGGGSATAVPAGPDAPAAAPASADSRGNVSPAVGGGAARDGGSGTAEAVRADADADGGRTAGEAGARAAGDAGQDARTAGAATPAGRRGDGPADPSRRLFVARSVAVAASVAGLGTVGYGAFDVLNGPALKHVTVPLAKLPRSAHGYRIAVVSDIHLGPVLGRSHTRRIVDTINGTQPDLVAIVGDLVDGSVDDLGPAAEPLADLRSRDGSFFVTGNHEYFSGAGQWVDFVRELGVHPLENARVELPGFDLAGVNDISAEGDGPAGEGPDFVRALGDRDTSRASVLLAHQPVVIHDAVEHGVDLQLSGHTHGGQLWPGPLLAGLANPTVAGLERYGDTQLYVSRGAGAWGPPVRVGAESDVTIVTLASKQT